MRPPKFWWTGGIPAAALAPLAAVTRVVAARRARMPGWPAPVPVICCGNATVGGTGKTPVCLDIVARLRLRGVDAHVLTRGYGGAAKAATRVDPARHDAAMVGDEALLLAHQAPTWVGADRAATARLAIADGAQVLVMDDGLQNPSLAKSCIFLVIDGQTGFGNGRLLPAGPLREPVRLAAGRSTAAIMMGRDVGNAAACLPPALPVLQAWLMPAPEMLALAGRDVLAFAGIGRPEKFFASLEQAGAIVCDRVSFADHHRYKASELARLRARAATQKLALVTTQKDFVRISVADREGIIAAGITVSWGDGRLIDQVLAGVG